MFLSRPRAEVGRLAAIDRHAQDIDRWLIGPRSNTIRTARSRSSGEYLLGRVIRSILSRNGPSDKPGRIQYWPWPISRTTSTRSTIERVDIAISAESVPRSSRLPTA
jgi:hypothetical protein